MSDTAFVSKVTSILATWLNKINDRVFKGRDHIYVTSSGTGAAFVVTLPATSLYSALTEGDEFAWKAHAANSASATLQIVGSSTLAAKNLHLSGSALVGGEIQIGDIVKVRYDGTQFQIINVSPYKRQVALSSGSSLVGFVQSGSGGIAETVAAALQRFIFAAQFTTFAQALTAAATKRLRINSAVTISSNTTLPATLEVAVERGGSFAIDSGIVLTVNSPFSAGLYQVFSGAGTVVFNAGSVNEVYPDWWGSAVNAIKTAHTAVTGKYIPVRLVPGVTYQFSSKWSITNHGDAVLGSNQTNDATGDSPAGAIVEYIGTSGTAIEAGVSPGVNATFLSKLTLEGFVLKLHENTDIGLRCWHLAGRSKIKDITVFGSSDKDTSNNTGMIFEGCIDTIVERPLVKGNGTAAGSSTYLQYGIRIINGFNNSVTTTFRLVHPYVTQCNWAYSIEDDSTVVLYSPVAESCHDAGLVALNAKVALHDPWFEDNAKVGGDRAAIRLQGTAAILNLDGGRINIGALPNFIQAEAANKINLLGGTSFASTHASPVLLLTGGEAATMAVLGENSYSANMVLWDPAFAGNNKLLSWKSGKLSLGGDTNHTGGITRTLFTSVGWDPGSLADGAGETSAAITVTGAALGDFVIAAAPYDLQGITCNGYVAAADAVKIRLQNETGGTIDLASGTWKVFVLKAS